MKKILPCILLVWPYLFFLYLKLWGGSDGMIVFLGGYTFLTVAVYLLNIGNACLYRGENAPYELAFWDMVIKLVHIPFYVLVFFIGLVVLMASVVPALLFISPMMVFCLFLIDLFLMITSSMYGVNALVRAGKQGDVSSGYVLVHVVLHFIMVLDVISAVLVFFRLRKTYY